jgi:hypothetical protein
MLNSHSIRDVGFVLVLTFALVLLLTVPALAGVPVATPAPTPTLLSGIGTWQAIDGNPLEYTFRYSGQDRPAQIMLAADPAGSVGFNAYTDAQWKTMGGGSRGITPIGQGTHNAFAQGDLYWELESPDGGLYHIQVFNLKPGDAHFWIAKSGSGTSGLTPVSAAYVPATAAPAAKVAVKVAPKAVVTPTVALAPKAVVTPTLAAKVAVTPTVAAKTTLTTTVAAAPKVTATPVPAKPAVAPTAATLKTGIGNWQAIDGSPLEYTFAYTGENNVAQIMLGMDPADSVRFDVYTDAQWRALGAGNRTIKPIGRGTANSNEGGDLSYQLASPDRGLYHVQVSSNLGSGDARFWIASSGAGTSGLTPVSPAYVPATPAKK